MTEQEQQEWDTLNKLLRQHGLRPVCLNDPGACRNLTEMIPMDKQSSQAIRYALKTLLEETERQRKIVRGLIEDNRQLRDELRLERSRASRQEQRANDLEIIVENIKHKIRQLEDESIAHACQQQNQVKELHKDYQASQTKYYQQINKMEKQEETIARLQKELHRLNMEEEERITTQKKMFRQFCKQASRTRLDQQRYKEEIDHTLEDDDKFLKNMDATPNYKALLMSFQTQIIETKARNEQLLHENTNLKKEMEIRPTVQELKLYKHQIKKLEKTLKNIRSHEICKEEELKENIGFKSNTGGDQVQETCRKYLQILLSIDSVIRSPRRAPLVMYMQKKELPQSCPKENEKECAFEHLPLTIEMWADQLMSLKNLHRSLKKLFLRLVPWYMESVEDNKCIRVEDLQMMVDEISEEVEDKEKNSSIPSQQTLYAIVSHFQKLFDVHSLNGVYPRMNEVYMKLGEMTNAMRNLRDALELDNTSPPSVLVNTVGKLCSLFRQNVTWQVEQLLGTHDIQSIIYKLEEHENFFPAFKALIEDLFHVLEVKHLTDIVPAVQKLKQRAQ
uniref:Centrosomal protein of 70 kDa n=1 Tax=Salvator merianae TaxID=96440 RepID=A0A8D0CEM8_SALMN